MRYPRRGPPQMSAGMTTPVDETARWAEFKELPMPRPLFQPMGVSAPWERQRRAEDMGKGFPTPPKGAARPVKGAGAAMETGKPRGGLVPPRSATRRKAGVPNQRKKEAVTPVVGLPPALVRMEALEAE